MSDMYYRYDIGVGANADGVGVVKMCRDHRKNTILCNTIVCRRSG